MPDAPPSHVESALVRAIGVRSLTANIVNATVGAGIFVLPAIVSRQLGSAAPVGYLVCAVVIGLIVACFALAGSRVSLSGGPYAYVEVAFGPYVGFLAGVMLWVTDALAVSGIASALADQTGALAPALGTGPGRVLLIATLVGALAAVNVRGVRAGVRLVEVMTVLKLVPLLLFVGVGLVFVRSGNLAWPGMPPAAAIGETAVLLIFAFVGVEIALAPSGEVRNTARTVPVAVFSALGIVTLLYMAVQFVAQGTAGPALAGFQTAPLAEAARPFLGPGGRVLLLVGATVSMSGYMTGSMLSSPRAIFAFARDGLFPAVLARVHRRYRTPHVAVLTHAAIVIVLANSTTFDKIAVAANVVVLSLYLLCCLAAWQLVRRGHADGTPGFTMPGERVIPFIACGLILWVMSHAPVAAFTAEAGVLVVASALFWLRRWRQPTPRAGA
jgi:APA family basic amino acid/polyamine antiporter